MEDGIKAMGMCSGKCSAKDFSFSGHSLSSRLLSEQVNQFPRIFKTLEILVFQTHTYGHLFELVYVKKMCFTLRSVQDLYLLQCFFCRSKHSPGEVIFFLIQH